MAKVCAVRDRAIDAFMQPMFVQATGQAIRAFMDECNRADSPIAAHPEDYDLYLIGEYEENSGLLVACTPPKMLAIGKDSKTT